MNGMTPALNGLDLFVDAFIVVALVGALVSLVIIGETLVSFAGTNHRPRGLRDESNRTYHRRLVTSH